MGLIVRPTKAGGSGDYVAGNDILAFDANGDANTIYTLVNGNINKDNINTTAGIKGTQLASAPDGVAAVNINTDAVETAKIKDLNVTKAKLAASAVTLDKTKVQTESIAFNTSLGSFDVTAIVFNNTTHLLLGYYLDTLTGLSGTNWLMSFRKTATGNIITIQKNTSYASTGNVVFIFIDRT